MLTQMKENIVITEHKNNLNLIKENFPKGTMLLLRNSIIPVGEIGDKEEYYFYERGVLEKGKYSKKCLLVSWEAFNEKKIENTLFENVHSFENRSYFLSQTSTVVKVLFFDECKKRANCSLGYYLIPFPNYFFYLFKRL